VAESGWTVRAPADCIDNRTTIWKVQVKGLGRRYGVEAAPNDPRGKRPNRRTGAKAGAAIRSQGHRRTDRTSGERPRATRQAQRRDFLPEGMANRKGGKEHIVRILDTSRNVSAQASAQLSITCVTRDTPR